MLAAALLQGSAHGWEAAGYVHGSKASSAFPARGGQALPSGFLFLAAAMSFPFIPSLG